MTGWPLTGSFPDRKDLSPGSRPVNSLILFVFVVLQPVRNLGEFPIEDSKEIGLVRCCSLFPSKVGCAFAIPLRLTTSNLLVDLGTVTALGIFKVGFVVLPDVLLFGEGSLVFFLDGAPSPPRPVGQVQSSRNFPLFELLS